VKIGMSVTGINDSKIALNAAGENIVVVCRRAMFNSAVKISERAKEILREKVRKIPPIYSTGKTERSIKVNILDKDRVTIGPDMRESPHSEWVEVGHRVIRGYTTKTHKPIGGTWWEGYHYMEGAWLEISPTIPKEVADSVTLSLKKFGKMKTTQLRNIKTGQFTPGRINIS